MTAARQFRDLLAAPGILVPPGVFNGFSARLVERAGYRAAAISGAGVSESFLGWADRGVLAFEDNLRVCRALADCVSIPLLADADTGNALNVRFTVRAFGETVNSEKPIARPDLMVPFDELNRLMELDELEAMDERYA
jgi:2-methylisocitrate lyase-like PEP mutase family enzyme